MFDRSEFPSDQDMAVIYWASIVVTLAVGVGCFYFAGRADALETVIALRVIGTLSLLGAILIVAVSKIISIFLG